MVMDCFEFLVRIVRQVNRCSTHRQSASSRSASKRFSNQRHKAKLLSGCTGQILRVVDMKLENVQYVVTNNIARIEMNRPQVLNALSKGMFRDLRRALVLPTKSRNAQLVELTGAGKAFSAGL